MTFNPHGRSTGTCSLHDVPIGFFARARSNLPVRTNEFHFNFRDEFFDNRATDLTKLLETTLVKTCELMVVGLKNQGRRKATRCGAEARPSD